MKKFLAAMFACSLAFSACFAVVGCGGGDGGVDGDAAPAEPDDAAAPDAAAGAGEDGLEKAGEGEGDSA